MMKFLRAHLESCSVVCWSTTRKPTLETFVEMLRNVVHTSICTHDVQTASAFLPVQDGVRITMVQRVGTCKHKSPLSVRIDYWPYGRLDPKPRPGRPRRVPQCLLAAYSPLLVPVPADSMNLG